MDVFKDFLVGLCTPKPRSAGRLSSPTKARSITREGTKVRCSAAPSHPLLLLHDVKMHDGVEASTPSIFITLSRYISFTVLTGA